MTRSLYLILVFIGLMGPTYAAVLIVNSSNDEITADDGQVTLREAIIAAEMDAMTDLGDIASGIDVIDLTQLSGQINLGSVLPMIETELVLLGPGESVLEITGGGSNGIFFINGGTLLISELSISGGDSLGGRGGDANVDGAGGGAAGLGAAVLVNVGQANLFRSIFDDNQVAGGRGGNSAGSTASSFGGTGGGGFSTDAGNDVTVHSFGSGGGNGGPYGSIGGAGGIQNGSNGQNGDDGAGGGGGGTTGATRAGDGGFAAGGGGAGSSISAAGPAGVGGFGGGGGGGTVDSNNQSNISAGAEGGSFGGNGGNGSATAFGAAGGGGAGLGGAVFVRDGAVLMAYDVTFSNNTASQGLGGQSLAGGQGGQNGMGKGGAIFVSDTAMASIDQITYSTNSASNANSAPQDNGDIFGATVSGQFTWLEFSNIEILVTESTGSIQIPVTIMTSDSEVTANAVDLTVSSRDIEATVGVDYSAINEAINIPSGTTSGSMFNIPVTVINDMDSEPNERFRLEISSVSGAFVDTRFIQLINILDGASPDVQVNKTDNTDLIGPGETLDYSIVVTNEGNVDLDQVRVVDTLPTELINASWICVAGFNAQCSAMGSGDIDDLITLPVGSSVTYLLTATVSPAAVVDISNTVTVSLPFALIDANPGNNTSNDMTAIDLLFQDGFEDVLRIQVLDQTEFDLDLTAFTAIDKPVSIVELIDQQQKSILRIQLYQRYDRRLLRSIDLRQPHQPIGPWLEVNEPDVIIDW